MHNVIADHVCLTGTCRSFTPEIQSLIQRRMGDICCGVGQTFGAQISMDYQSELNSRYCDGCAVHDDDDFILCFLCAAADVFPPTVNDYPECVQKLNGAAAKIVGSARSGMPQKTMGAEDFSFFLQKRPGCFFFVGAALPGEARPHHKSVFDFDEVGF